MEIPDTIPFTAPTDEEIRSEIDAIVNNPDIDFTSFSILDMVFEAHVLAWFRKAYAEHKMTTDYEYMGRVTYEYFQA